MMNLKDLTVALFFLAAACSRSEPPKTGADGIPGAKALYEEVYAEYVTKAIHPESALKKLERAMKLLPEDHEYHRKIVDLKTRIKEQQEPPEPPPQPDREEAQWIPPPEMPDETSGLPQQKEVRELLEKGKQLVREKKLEEATEVLEKAAGLDEQNCHVLVSLGIVYARRGKREPAAKAYEKFLELCPQHMQAPQIRSIVAQYHDFKKHGGERIPPPPVADRKPTPKGVGSLKDTPSGSQELERQGMGLIDVGVSGNWAFVYIDGKKIRTTPLLNHKLKTGEYLVELKDGEGNLVYSWAINLRPGRRIKLLLH